MPHVDRGHAPGTTAKNKLSFPMLGGATQRSGDEFIVAKFGPGPSAASESNSSLPHLGRATHHATQRRTSSRIYIIRAGATQRSGHQFIFAKFGQGQSAGAESNSSLPHLGRVMHQAPQLRTNYRFQFWTGPTQWGGHQFIVAKFGPGAKRRI